ncbi:ATP-binding protein [Actinoallomurus sp. NPDC052308]|uniref:ATP-binding protein n=1 Tax=Actinoallomurus sp. NPDC052308 TaxID=3155530 RepID=UPI0034421DE2
MTEPPAAVAASPVVRPSFLALRDRPEAIHRLRTFVGAAVFGLPYAVDEIELVAGEIVTNAIRAVRTLGRLPKDVWPIGIEMTATPRYVHLAVTDLDHRPIAARDAGGLLAEQGRGLHIVDHLAVARWITYAEHGKTVHVVIAAPGITLAPAELQRIREAR